MSNYPEHPGTIKQNSSSSIPAGYLLCDGRAVSRTTYAALFAWVGTTYGVGDGSTTFNLPDPRGRAVIGAGSGVGLTARALADTLGEETHQLNITEMPSHAHSVYGGGFGGDNQWSNGFWGGNGSGNHGYFGTTGAGNDGPHNNMQPSIVLNLIIKY